MEEKKIIYSMGEVAEMFDVNASLIRYWETQFEELKPRKNKKGNRLFSPADIETLKLIYHLVKERGMTLEGAKRSLRQSRGEVSRDSELLERLQRIRAQLAEVREELKATDREWVAGPPAPQPAPSVRSAAPEAETEQPQPAAAPKAPRGRTAKRPEAAPQEKELFAFYEQSLFQNSHED